MGKDIIKSPPGGESRGITKRFKDSRIPVQHPRSGDHHSQRNDEQDAGHFAKDDQRQENTNERSDRIIGAGLRRTEIPLSIYVQAGGGVNPLRPYHEAGSRACFFSAAMAMR